MKHRPTTTDGGGRVPEPTLGAMARATAALLSFFFIFGWVFDRVEWADGPPQGFNGTHALMWAGGAGVAACAVLDTVARRRRRK